MSLFLKFLPLKKFPLQLLYMKSHIRQGPHHLLRTADTACCIYCNYVCTNLSVMSSATFYAACPFLRFVALQTPFRWSLNIKKMKLENGGESMVNWASLVHKVARKKTLRINNFCVTFCISTFLVASITVVLCRCTNCNEVSLFLQILQTCVGFLKRCLQCKY